MSDMDFAEQSGAAVAIQHATVDFGKGRGVFDVSLSVGAGERLAVIGPSGAGKSTVLRAIAGLVPLNGGCVKVADRDVTRIPPNRRSVVYLHQTPMLFSHLSVGENVAFPLRVRGKRGAEVGARVKEVLSAMQLGGFEERSTKSLSGGQRHRVALARAIAARPGALLLDEPLSALDPSLRADIRTAIAEAQAEYGPAILIVSHDLDDIGVLADRVAVVIDGNLVETTTPSDLFARPGSLAVARFLGTYQEMNGRVRSDGDVDCALGCLPASTIRGSAAADEPVTVTIAPEGIMISSSEGAVRGRVIAIQERARTTGLIVEIPATGLVLEVTRPARDNLHRVGDVVPLWVDASRTFCFRG